MHRKLPENREEVVESLHQLNKITEGIEESGKKEM